MLAPETAVQIEDFPKDIALRGRRASPKNTVPSDKNGLPARCPLIPYSQTKNTVLPDKKYRTGRQIRPFLGPTCPASESSFNKSPAKAVIIPRKGTRRAIPYPPTRNTVLSDKEYRTLRQGIPYRAAKHSVLSNKLGV